MGNVVTKIVMASSKLDQTQAISLVKKYASTSMVLTLAGISTAYYFSPVFLDKIGLPAHERSSQKLNFALQCHLVTVSVILLIVSLVALKRVKHAWDPTNAATVQFTEVPNKILTNTVEQYLLFIPSTLMLSTYLDKNQTALIPILINPFALGRLIFTLGYLTHPIYRAPGFAMGMCLQILCIGLNLYFTEHLFISIPTTLVLLIIVIMHLK